MKIKRILTFTLTLLIFLIYTGYSQSQNCESGDCYNGKGIINYGDRSYEGEFKNGKKDGFGTFKWSNGASFTGKWKEDNRVEGIDNMYGGFHYEGQYKNNLREGRGKFTWTDGSFYEGEWIKDNMNGRGIKKWPDGSRYEGEWKNGLHNGKGKYFWANGETYDGDWKDNMMNGSGTYTWTDGKIYTGQYLNGKRSGLGVLKFKNGDTYSGSWSMDLNNGYGTFTWANGQKYVGNFKNDVFHGTGIMYNPDGTVKNRGTWYNGNLTDFSTYTNPYANKGGETETKKEYKKEYRAEDYEEISIRLSELPAWKIPYADGEGKYYYLIAQERCEGLAFEQWYQDRGFIGSSHNNINFCGRKMPPGYQVFVKPVLFIWGKARTASEIADSKKKKETVQPSYSEAYFKSGRYTDCIETCHKNQCRSKYNISDTAQKACSESCANQCKDK